MNPLLRNSEAHVFVASLASPQLSFEDEHHLDRSLRLEETDPVTVSDGQGRWATATWSRRRGLELTSQIHQDPERPPLTIGCAIPKGDRPELVVQKLTELGINRISFYETKRSVVHWDDERRSKQHERMYRIAREAAMQSRRTFLPKIEFTSFERMLEQHGMAIAEVGGRDPIDEGVHGILVGPEGGFDREELDYAVPKIGLSRNILRVETAAIVAAAQLVAFHQ
ncbi:MAG: RsmE family RNA methyltransferase [Acidimicrobiales bacterium]